MTSEKRRDFGEAPLMVVIDPAVGVYGLGTQSKIVAQLILLVAISVSHRSCSVTAEPLHRWRRLARRHGGSRLCAGLSFETLKRHFSW